MSFIPHVPSQWAFNGMSEEMAGNIYGPLATVPAAISFAHRVRRGEWMLNGNGMELVMVLERWEDSVVALGALMGMSTGRGLNSDLIYTNPINPTKRPGLTLSSVAQHHLEQLTVADELVYQAASDRLNEKLQCLHLSDCFTHSYQSTVNNEGFVSELLEAHSKTVNEAKAHCEDNKNSSLCASFELSDREWSMHVNSQLPKQQETATQVYNDSYYSCLFLFFFKNAHNVFLLDNEGAWL